jgi:hypothetical protein
MLVKKVLDREKQWLQGLRGQLERNGIIDDKWRAQVELFVRRDAKPELERSIGVHEDVIVHSLEDLGYPWAWDWRKE